MGIKDDFSILDRMIKNHYKCPPELEVDGITKKWMSSFISDIKKKGMQKMLKTHNYFLHTIGAVNYDIFQQMQYNFHKEYEKKKISKKELEILISAAKITLKNKNKPLLPYNLSQNDLDHAMYRACDLYAQVLGTKRPKDFTLSLKNDPSYYFKVGKKNYSYMFFYYFLRYCFCASEVDFDKIDNFVEIGSGSGRIVELLKQLHPNLTFHLFDLPPQLYTANRLLSSVYPKDVVDFQEINSVDYKERRKGIHFHNHYEIEKFETKGTSISWNAMVFCIMSRSKVKRYLKYLSKFSEWIYIVDPLSKEVGYDNKNPVTKSDLLKILSDKYRLIKTKDADWALSKMKNWGGVKELIFKKNFLKKKNSLCYLLSHY